MAGRPTLVDAPAGSTGRNCPLIQIDHSATPLADGTYERPLGQSHESLSAHIISEGEADGEHATLDEHGAFQDGMLPRDVPKRTTFYDPVAERQMSQTDAKLFYQRSKIDVRTAGTTAGWAPTSPSASPVMTSASQPMTEYGADSLMLEQDHSMLECGSWKGDWRLTKFRNPKWRQTRSRTRAVNQLLRQRARTARWIICHS